MLAGGDPPEVTLMPRPARTAERAMRRVARLLLGRNQLRRPCDRVEGAVVVFLLAAFLVAIAGAALLGAHIYHDQRAAAARLHPSVAVLTEAGPSNTGLTGAGQATARWRTPGGREASGVLTTGITPGITDAPDRARVQIWLTASGQVAAQPPGAAELMFTGIVIAISAACGAGAMLMGGYGLARLLIDRRRLAAWESAWEMIGPQWTPRRLANRCKVEMWRRRRGGSGTRAARARG
jgi:hypothetical protein